MKEVIIIGKPFSYETKEVPIPTPGDNQVLIKVYVSGSNPKDWKYPVWTDRPHNSGDDIGGVVEAVGKNVLQFRKGDRVGAFHQMGEPHGSFAEYAIAEEYTTFHIPASVSFAEAATYPLVYLTAIHGLFYNLRLPTPWAPATTEIPLVIYGASTSVGAAAVKLAKKANIGPIIGVAGKSGDFAKSIGCDFVVDYRAGSVADQIKAVLKPGQVVEYVFDTISEGGSYVEVAKAVARTPAHKIATVLPIGDDKPADTNMEMTLVARSHNGVAAEKDLACVACRQLTKWLQEGSFPAHPYEIVPGGLDGVLTGLEKLMNNQVSASKQLFVIAE
ncbi:chaperonin 10-like protein [Dipodascopsis tothii]|uniref:chaperonin 10-like protein n=1 Tax=Dipodascopsis tothii TaxID=44089 RepID=UPI0034CE5535